MDGQLHIISTGQQSIDTFSTIVARIHEMVDAIHIREKTWTAIEMIEAVDALVRQGVPLQKIIINDRVDVAYVMGTGGVQLAHHSIDVLCVKRHFPSLQVGCSVHSVAEAVEAEAAGANYVLYGHIFPTRSKPGLPPKGLQQLSQLVQHVRVPVMAIGGMTPERTSDVLEAGAHGIAVLSGVLLADHPQKAVQDYVKALQRRR
ncbi:MAG TPA: thiazole tautomerase TenI [Bacillota bacterium]|nr:thiazole tautomerase TenI [Bacillota bacterium]